MEASAHGLLRWQPSSSAILVVRSPCQLKETIRARNIQSPGAWRLPASLRIFSSSSASSGWRACSSFGMISSPFPIRRLGLVLMYTAFEERSNRMDLPLRQACSHTDGLLAYSNLRSTYAHSP